MLCHREFIERRSLFAILAATALLTACNAGGTQTSTPIPSPCPLFPIPAPPQMTYPAPNATGIPDGNFNMQFTYRNSELATQYSAPAVMASSAPTVTGGPYAIVPTPGAFEYTSAIGALHSSTTYTVQVVTPPQGGHCSTTETLGSFTTQ